MKAVDGDDGHRTSGQRRPGRRRRAQQRVAEGVGVQPAAVDLDAEDLLAAGRCRAGRRARSGRSARTGWPCSAPRTGAAPGRRPPPSDRPGRRSSSPGAEKRPTSAALSRASTTSRTAPACSHRWPVAISSSVCRVGEPPAMLLAQLELHLEARVARSLAHDLLGAEGELREALAALDARQADVGAEVEVGRQRALGDGRLERAAAGDGRDARPRRRSRLPTGRALVGHHPARHRDLERAHQVPALLEVAFERRRVVAGIERARGARGRTDPDLRQVPLGQGAPVAGYHVRPPPVPRRSRPDARWAFGGCDRGEAYRWARVDDIRGKAGRLGIGPAPAGSRNGFGRIRYPTGRFEARRSPGSVQGRAGCARRCAPAAPYLRTCAISDRSGRRAFERGFDKAPTSSAASSPGVRRSKAGPEGFEPPTGRFEACCYVPICRPFAECAPGCAPVSLGQFVVSHDRIAREGVGRSVLAPI